MCIAIGHMHCWMCIAGLVRVQGPEYVCMREQEHSTRKRLEHQKVLLTGSVGYMRARLALEGAFAAPEAGKGMSDSKPAVEDLQSSPQPDTPPADSGGGTKADGNDALPDSGNAS